MRAAGGKKGLVAKVREILMERTEFYEVPRPSECTHIGNRWDGKWLRITKANTSLTIHWLIVSSNNEKLQKRKKNNKKRREEEKLE